LAAHPFPHLEESILTAFFTPPEKHTDNDKKAIRNSNEAVAELMAADAIVISVPMYNFAVPSVLKAWIDHVCRAGVTFRYTANGPEGLVKGKKVYLAIASGGVYSSGPMKAYDFTESYLRTVLGFLGMTDIEVYRVEGVAVPDLQATALEKAVASIRI
jgi:FMN-dependent NADH-azoreductase